MKSEALDVLCDKIEEFREKIEEGEQESEEDKVVWKKVKAKQSSSPSKHTKNKSIVGSGLSDTEGHSPNSRSIKVS
jgi:hypothetical protein